MPTFILSEQELIDRVQTGDKLLTRAAVNAIVAARDAPGTLRQIANLIRAGRIEDAVNAAARAGAISMQESSAAVYIESGKKTASWLSRVLGVVVDFDQFHNFAVRRMQQNRLTLVREWTAVQRVTASQVLTQAVEEGLNPIDTARRFRASTGLTARQQSAVSNYRRLLQQASTGNLEALTRQLRDRRFDGTIRRAAREGVPLTSAQIDRQVARYQARYIAYRARTIARTESLRSVNSGLVDAFRMATDDGLLTAEQIQREWVSASDERVRPTHWEANGQKVPGFDTPFVVGAGSLLYPGDPNGPAEEVINCRCAQVVRVKT